MRRKNIRVIFSVLFFVLILFGLRGSKQWLDQRVDAASQPVQSTTATQPTSNFMSQMQDMEDVERQKIRVKLEDKEFRKTYATQVVDGDPGIEELSKQTREQLIDQLTDWLNPDSVYTYGNLASTVSMNQSLASTANFLQQSNGNVMASQPKTKEDKQAAKDYQNQLAKSQKSANKSAMNKAASSGVFKKSVVDQATQDQSQNQSTNFGLHPAAVPIGQVSNKIPYQSNPSSGSTDFYTYAQEWKPLTGNGYGPDQTVTGTNDGLPALYLTGTLKQQQYTTPKSEGGILGIGAKTNSFYNMSYMYLTTNTSLTDQGSFAVGYYQDNQLDRWENGHLQMSGHFPMNANIHLALNPLVAQRNFTDGNYGAYIRVQVPAGVDTTSFAQSINWNRTGGSDNFDINALGIHIPLIDNFISTYGGYVHFPLTWYPQETSVSPDVDPRAFYIGLGGMPTSRVTATNMGDRGTVLTGNNTALTAIPLQVAQDTFIRALIGIASIGLGNISGQVGGYITFDMTRYGGNYSTAELNAMGYSPTTDADIYAGADDSPNKLLTKGTLPPDSSNLWKETYTPFFSDSMLAPDSMMSATPGGIGGWQNALINSDNLTKQAVPTNTLPTWSTYFSPIDSTHTVYTGSIIDQYTDSKDHNNGSYNIKNQLDSSGKYVSGEFQEVKDSSDPNYNYHYVLDGENYRSRKITMYYDKDGYFSAYPQKRFYRVIDYFHKKDITNDPDTTLDPLTARDPATGTVADGSQFTNFMNSNFNKPIQVYYNGTSNSADGNAAGSEINSGPINSNNVKVTQWVKPSVIQWADSDSYPRPAQSSVNSTIPLSGLIYSKDAWFAKMYYRVNGGSWQQFSPLNSSDTFTTPTVGKTTGPGPLGSSAFDLTKPNWHLNLSFDTPGKYKVEIKATDNFGVDSEIGNPTTQTPGNLEYDVLIGQGYNMNLNYLLTSNNQPIKYKNGDNVSVPPYFVDTSQSDDFTFNVGDYTLQKELNQTQRKNLGTEYHFDYVTVDDPASTTHYQQTDQIPFNNLSSDHTIYYHYTPIALAFNQVPTLFDFGTRVLPKVGEKFSYLPASINGHLSVISVPSGDTTWSVQVQSSNLMLDQQHPTHMPVAQAIYYYRSPGDSSLLSSQTQTMVYSANGTNMPPSTSGANGSTIYQLDSDWKTSPNNHRNDDLSTDGFKNGFVLKPQNQTDGELYVKEKYTGTITWSLTNSIN